MPDDTKTLIDKIMYDPDFQAACQRYAHANGSSQAIASAALRAFTPLPLPLPSDVVALVCAARAALESEDLRSVHADKLTEAVDAFASRVCFDDEGGTLPEAHAIPCTCGGGK